MTRWISLAFFLMVVNASPATSPRLQDALGICGHTIRFDAEEYQPAFSQVRDYHPIPWDLLPDTSRLPPWPKAKNGVDWQSVYGSWNQAGFRTIASLMFTRLPADGWTDLGKDAFAYGKSFAETFGPSGMGVIETVEIGNEPGHYSDEDYLRLFRAMARGVRAGDPDLKIATCAARDQPSGKYHKSLDLFLEDLDLVDVLTVHVYAEVGGWPHWHRTYPEDPETDFLLRVEDAVAWRDRHAPGKAVWVTEYGWDATTRFEERSGDFSRWEGNVSDEAQAAYLVRATALLLSQGIERSYIYFFDDSDQPQLHGSSGVMRNGTPKPSFHALSQMQAILGEYSLVKMEKMEDQVIRTRWQNIQGESRFLCWRGSEAAAVKVTMEVPEGGPWEVRSMKLSESSLEPVSVAENQVLVGPSPVYLVRASD